ncbi:MAG: hypothetical protein HW380_2103 [Magnetococcales bacterium]|nr:hypothetical protein [Magnetococcales bacterium]
MFAGHYVPPVIMRPHGVLTYVCETLEVRKYPCTMVRLDSFGIAGVKGGSSPPTGVGVVPQGFIFEFKQEAPFTVLDLDFFPKGTVSNAKPLSP